MARLRSLWSWRVPMGLGIVLLAAALFRVLYFHAYLGQGILFDGMILDASIYDDWAQRIAGGAWIGTQPFYFAPLYPYLLAVVYKVAGHSYAVVYALQFALGLATIALLHGVALRLYGQRAALFAAAGAALYAPFAFYESKVLGTSLGLFLAVLALALVVRAEQRDDGRRKGAWAAAGLAIGAATLCTPAALLLAVLLAAWLLFRRRALPAGALLAGVFAALLPALAHNAAASGDWQMVSGQGGVTFWQGNNPMAVGLFMAPPGFTGSPERQPDEERAIAESETGRQLRRPEISAHFLRKGLGFVFGSPGRWLALEGRKLGYLVGSYEPATEYSLYVERGSVPVLWAAFLPFAAIVGLGLGGMLTGGRDDAVAGRPAGRGALALYTVWATAVPLLFYVSARYRLPLAPALLVYAGAFADRVVEAARSGERPDPATARGVMAALVIGMLSFFLLGTPLTTVEANVHYDLGSLLAARGRHEEAIVEYDRCLAAWPQHGFALVNRGNSLDHLGRTDEALETYRRAAAVQPTLWPAWQGQATMLIKSGRKADAVDVLQRALAAGAGGGEALYMLGGLLHDLGRFDEAREILLQAVAKQPGDPRYHNSLGQALQHSGRSEEAKAEYREAARLGPRYVDCRANLGGLLAEQGHLEEALAPLEEALRIEPDNVRARVEHGTVLLRLGRRDEARADFQAALRKSPYDPGARDGLLKTSSLEQVRR